MGMARRPAMLKQLIGFAGAFTIAVALALTPAQAKSKREKAEAIVA